MTSRNATIRIGDRVGDLLVERKIGQGRFGVVYLARDIVLGRRVALKVVATGSREEKRAVADEARLVAQLSNPHVVTLFRAAPHAQGAAWLLEMEYVDGESLEERLGPTSRPPFDRAHAILGGLLEALCAAHACGIVHGDIKAANILLARDGSVKLADFGLARLHADPPLDDMISDSTPGTPLYMAPEILLGLGVGPAADVWSLGVVLYRMLAGHAPFPTTSAAEMFHAVVNLPPLPFPSGGDPLLQRVALACLTKEPERRPSATALRRSLHERETIALAAPGDKAPSGRSRELGWLRAAVAESLAGQAKGVLLVGETGVGKTHLLEALRYDCGVEGLRWIGIAAGRGGPLAERLGARLGVGPAETASAAHTIASALASVAAATPTVVAVDDIDETGPDERRLLSHLLRHLENARVLLVASAQTREALPTFEHVELAPLGAADMAALLERELGHPLDAASVRWLVDRAEGRPLFAVAFLRQLQTEGSLRVDGGQARVTHFDLAPPVRIRDLVARQLADLPEEDREVLDAAAVDGLVFDGQALAAATGRRTLDVLRTLQRLCRDRALVMPDTDGFRFRSSYLRDAIYERLAPELRCRLHRVLATHLQSRGIDDSERLARHWEGAGDPERARRCYTRAAREAAWGYEPNRIIDLASRAGIVPGGVDRETALANSELMLRLAGQYVTSGRPEEADQLFDALLDAARANGDEQLYLSALVRRARSRFMEAGAAGAQLDELRRAIEVLPRGESHAMAHYVLGVFARNRGDLARARELLERADRLYDEAGLAGHRSTAKNVLANLAVREGRLREAERLYTDAAEIDRRFGRFWLASVTEFNRLTVEFRAGRLEGTVAAMEGHTRALLADGLRDLAAHARALAASVRWAEGDGRGARRDTDMAMAELATTGHLIGLVEACQIRTELAFASGRLDTMAEATAAGVEHARKIADVSSEMILTGYGALRAACCGELSAAAERIREALATGAKNTDSHAVGTFACVCAEAALLAASPRLVADVTKRIETHAGGFFVRPAEATLAAVAAWHERKPVPLFDAATLLRSEEIGQRRAAVRTLASLFEGRAYEVAGEPASARKSFRQALAKARALEHVWYQALALRRLGEPVDDVLAQVRPPLSARVYAFWDRET